MERSKISITITREFGSMGRAIGKRVAEKLGFKYYDRDIIENAAPLAGENLETLGKYDGHDYSSYPYVGDINYGGNYWLNQPVGNQSARVFNFDAGFPTYFQGMRGDGYSVRLVYDAE